MARKGNCVDSSVERGVEVRIETKPTEWSALNCVKSNTQMMEAKRGNATEIESEREGERLQLCVCVSLWDVGVWTAESSSF